MNYLLDNNVIIDLLSERRRKKYPKSLETYNTIQGRQDNIFISSSSLDNIEFILFKEIKAQFNYSKIPTAVHYPMPLHLQECFKYLGYREGDFPVAERISNEILSLPMNSYLTNEEIEYISDRVVS